MNPPGMELILRSTTASDVIAAAQRATESLDECFQIFVDGVDEALGDDAAYLWFAEHVPDTYPYLRTPGALRCWDVMTRRAKPHTFSSEKTGGNGRVGAADSHSFACVAAVRQLDDTPAYMFHSISHNMSCLFGGFPVGDTEHFDDAVRDFNRHFPAVFALEVFDEPLLRDLFARLLGALRKAQAEQAAHARDAKWRDAFRRQAHAIHTAVHLVARRSEEDGLVPPLVVPADVRDAAEAPPS